MKHNKPSKNGKIKLLILCMLILVGLFGFCLQPSISNNDTLPNKPHSPDPVALELAVDPESHFITYEDEVLPIMEQYCYECHMDGSEEGSLDLDKYTSFASMTQDRDSWHKIKQHLELKLMPPVDEEQPEEAETAFISNWIDNTVLYADPDNPDPGKVVLRRLNRNEYKNTIRDLLGVTIDIESLLPLDDTGYGFDTIADVHTTSPAHIEKYLNAAEIALNKATHIGEMPWNTIPYSLSDLTYHPQEITEGNFYINGTATIPTTNLVTGTYLLEVSASSTPAGNEEALLQIKKNQHLVKEIEVPHDNKIAVVTVKVNIDKDSKLVIEYPNDFYDWEHPNRSKRDRNLQLLNVKLTGPVDGKRPEKPASHYSLFPAQLISQSTEDYALETWHTFANKVFRRPVSLEEIRPYTQFLDQETVTEEALQQQILTGMQAMLCSPEFLYIQNTPQTKELPISPLSEIALASRLSYFLWSSTPDHTLLEKAKNNQLRATLTQEIDRMLADPKASRFINNFSGQWLQLRDLEVTSPDHKIFPKWTTALKNDAIKETQHFLRHLLENDITLLDCLNANYSFINRRLAKFYGIDNVKGKHFRKVTFTGDSSQRGGLLTQLSILTLTSYPDRTSPVLRGKWILENILGTAPPPPPGDIPTLEAESTHNASLSLRKQLEIHRTKAECAACHNLLDPLGFTLENYNAIGQWRNTENQQPIDTFGKLITGETFKNSSEMKTILRENKADEFIHCLTEKLLTYSIGRGLEYYDKHSLAKIVTETKNNQLTLRSLIHSICHSPPFQMTRTHAYSEN